MGQTAPLTTVNGFLVRRDLGDTEPRIHDLELAKRLGFASPIDIRKLIRRHVDAGNICAPGVFAAAAKTSEKGGRPGTEYWLDERSAIFVASQSGTTKGIAVTLEVIDVFVAVRHGKIPAPSNVTHLLLSDTVSEWEPMWKREIVDAFCEIYGKPKTKRPPRFMAGVQSLIYKGIAGRDCYDEMKRRIPEPHHKNNLHQLFNEKARKGFDGQLAVVLGVLKTSRSPSDFWERFNFLYSNRPMQLRLGDA